MRMISISSYIYIIIQKIIAENTSFIKNLSLHKKISDFIVKNLILDDLFFLQFIMNQNVYQKYILVRRVEVFRVQIIYTKNFNVTSQKNQCWQQLATRTV